MELTQQQQQGYNLIELRIINQRYIELLDDLDVANSPFKNKKLNQQLKGVYPVIDKETKKYNAMYDVSPEGTTQFYDTTCENAKFIMQDNLLNKTLICGFLMAHEKNSELIETIINQILTQNGTDR